MKTYLIFLHTSLVALAACGLYLVRQNQQLRIQLYPELVQLEAGQRVEPVAVTSLAGDPRLTSLATAGSKMFGEAGSLMSRSPRSKPACLVKNSVVDVPKSLGSQQAHFEVPTCLTLLSISC